MINPVLLDPANGMGSEIGELNMLTGPGERPGFAFADGKTPNSYETLSYAGGISRTVSKSPIAKKTTKKAGGLLAGYRKNQAAKQKQKAADSKNTASAIKAMS